MRLTRDQFIGAFPQVYLFRAPSSGPAIPPSTARPTAEQERAAQRHARDADADVTLRFDLPTNSASAVAGVISLDEGGVAEVRKQANAPPFNRLVIGRVTTNDIVLPFAEVSKVHAEFHVADHRVAAVRDRGSVNGTRVDGRRLSPGETMPVALGCRIAFGPVGFELVDGALLHDRMTALWLARGVGDAAAR